MAVRRLYEPLCIAFGTTVSSPTVPTYQLYDLPHKFTPRLYMESEDPNLVLREIQSLAVEQQRRQKESEASLSTWTRGGWGVHAYMRRRERR